MDPTTTANDFNTASQNATASTQALPGVLSDLKTNLNKIFSQDNPLIQQRTGMLQDYLGAGDKARADYLPTHSGFAFSPTELNAMVSGRQAAALAPLSAINNMVMGQYGGLKDYMGDAKDIFNAKVTADAQNADRLYKLYAGSLEQEKNKTANREIVEANGRKYLVDKGTGAIIADLGTSSSASSGLDWATALQLMGNKNLGGNSNALDNFWTSAPTTGPVQGPTQTPEMKARNEFQPSPGLASQSNWWDPIANFFNPKPSNLTSNLSSLSGGNLSLR